MILLVLAVVLLMTAKPDPSAPPAPFARATPSAPQLASTGFHWLITSKALTQLSHAGASASFYSKAIAASSYVIDNAGSPGVGVHVATYTSYSAIRHAFLSGALPGDYKAVIYDNEDWAGTPAAEQHDPAKYEQLVAHLLHEHGLLYIATPAVDLVDALNPGTAGAGQYRAYLSDKIAADAARYANIIDIQAQRAEASTSEYANFVTSAAAQARRANPRVVVLAGLKSGNSFTAAELSAAYSSVTSVVNGFWLNIPGKSRKCPSCGSPDPQPALALLRHIYG